MSRRRIALAATLVAVVAAGTWLVTVGRDQRRAKPEAEGAGHDSPSKALVTREMAVTLDDLPQNSRLRGASERRSLNGKLLRALEAAGVPAVGFVNAAKCYESGRPVAVQREILTSWLEAGHELGNHTWSHPDYTKVDLAAFVEDVERGEPLLRELGGGEAPRWFRHPYLHRGGNDVKREALERYLADRGYSEAPVTIDNGEWIYAAAYEKAVLAGRDELAARLAESYLEYMMEVVHFWESQSDALFHRNLRHVLLLHANLLNADHLAALLGRLRSMGYRFVTLEEALEDPAYDSEDRYSGPAGISWIHRWALTRQVDPSLFAGEPRVPDWVREAMRGDG